MFIRKLFIVKVKLDWRKDLTNVGLTFSLEQHFGSLPGKPASPAEPQIPLVERLTDAIHHVISLSMGKGHKGKKIAHGRAAV